MDNSAIMGQCNITMETHLPFSYGKETNQVNEEQEPAPLTQTDEEFDKLGLNTYKSHQSQSEDTSLPDEKGEQTQNTHVPPAPADNKDDNNQETDNDASGHEETREKKEKTPAEETKEYKQETPAITEDDYEQEFIYDAPTPVTYTPDKEEKNSYELTGLLKKYKANILIVGVIIIVSMVIGIAGKKKADSQKESELTVSVQPAYYPTYSSVRFNDTEDLTSYIKDNQNLLMEKEMTLVRDYQKGGITSEKYNNEMNRYIQAAQELNNLLIANQHLYDKETYDNMCNTMNQILTYGNVNK